MTRTQAISMETKIKEGQAAYRDASLSMIRTVEILAELGEFIVRYGDPLVELLYQYAEERKLIEDAIYGQSGA